MEKVGFFGGCFNPPTNIHINLANKLIKDRVLDKVYFVHVGDYYKKTSLVSAMDRFNMLKLATADYKNIEIDDIVCKSEKRLFAIDTFKLLSEKYNKKFDIYFIMGSDNFEKMPEWKDYEELISNYKFVVIERINHSITIKNKNVINYKNSLIQEDMSSTKIRNMIKANKDVTEYINKDVIKYIKSNKLYIDQDIF